MKTRLPGWSAACAGLLIAACLAAGCTRHHRADAELYSSRAFTVYSDSVIDESGASARATSSLHIISRSPDGTVIKEWRAATPTADRFPRLTTGMKLPDALYNMAIAEISSDTAANLTPYAILLSQGALNPERAIRSLRGMVKNGRISGRPETCRPIDIGRVAWILAADAVFKATGDTEWAREYYEVARRSLSDDHHVNYRPDMELYCGSVIPIPEASDYYPAWMEAADIYSSFSLTANVLYARAYSVMAETARRVATEHDDRYDEIAARLSHSVNLNFWLPGQSRYSQYLYGQMPVASEVTDNLGQSMCVVWDIAIAEMSKRLFEKTPVAPYGTPAVWPAPFYTTGRYCGCVRPVVEAFRAMAAAKMLDGDALMASLGAQMRTAALNAAEVPFVDAYSGNQLKMKVTPAERTEAAAARLSAYFRILAGIEYGYDGIEFHPVVPPAFKDEKYVTGLRYRDAELTVVVHGTGTRIARFTIDGETSSRPFFPAEMTGRHEIEITMANNAFEPTRLTIENNASPIPRIPRIKVNANGSFDIESFTTGYRYEMWVDGHYELTFAAPSYTLPWREQTTIIAVARRDADGRLGYTARPWLHLTASSLLKIPVAQPGEDSRTAADITPGFAMLCDTVNTHLPIEVEARGGIYLADVHYANGAGPARLQDRCAIRTLLVNGDRAGVFVMPQLADGDWSVTAYSNMLIVRLEDGLNTLALDYVVPYDINEATDNNTVWVDYVRLIRFEPLY